MMKNKFSLFLVLAIVLAVIMGVISLYFFRQVKVKEAEMNEMVEVMNFEKEQVEREFEELNYEFDGYTSNIKNDSIFKLLDKEKARVQQLLEELRITKVTNARRIAELRKELATVRGVMVHYVNQIDSLNKENKVLKTENVEVRRRYQEASQTAQQLAKEKDNLDRGGNARSQNGSGEF
jgi:predicted  nucleic acid-binding Zn-ribbon protein